MREGNTGTTAGHKIKLIDFRKCCFHIFRGISDTGVKIGVTAAFFVIPTITNFVVFFVDL